MSLSKISEANTPIINEYLGTTTIVKNKSRAETLADIQKNDMLKVVDLTYMNNIGRTDAEIMAEIDQAAFDQIEKISLSGADVIASETVNDAVLDLSKEYENESGEKIVSYTFNAVMDEDTTAICAELHNSTWAENDPDLLKYTAPLHFNCRSYLTVNTTATSGNPEVTGTPTLTKKAQSEIQLSDKPVKKRRVVKKK
jgi:hypothetical protein